jgi:putative transposase
MSRISRNDLLYKGCYSHVISRSIRKIRLFDDGKDFDRFKELLLLAKRRAEFKIYHYCIMHTHFHLAVAMSDVQEFSCAIRDLKRSYVYWFHEKYRISGPVWRERFKSLLIADEDYLFACGKYIEENPVKAGLVHQSTDWVYSSARHYYLEEKDELLDDYCIQPRLIDGLIMDEKEFEGGSVIGSNFFKFQFFENRKISERVP